MSSEDKRRKKKKHKHSKTPATAAGTSTTPTVGIWQWREGGVWKPYQPAIEAELEQHYQKCLSTPSTPSQYDLTIGRSSYVADVSAMTQTNNRTGYVRTIRRLTGTAFTAAGPLGLSSAAMKALGSPVPVHRTPSHSPSPDLGRVGLCRTVSDTLSEEEKKSLMEEAVTDAVFVDELVPPHDGKNPDRENCCLCLMEFEDNEPAIRLRDCAGHYFHKDCGLGMTIKEYIRSKKKCPSCGKFYGLLFGDQTPGTMTVALDPTPLPGYPDCGTLTMTWSMRSGTQGSEHPNPGQSYSSTNRSGYLPDNEEGREVCEMFIRAFKQKLVFSLGYSVTRQQDGVIIWNGIHVKTSQSGGTSNWGYPDDTYLSRVKLEMAAKGIYPRKKPATEAADSKTSGHEI